MRNALKKSAALLMCAVFILSLALPAAAEEEYTVRDAYYECAAMYPEFVEAITSQGVTDDQIIALLETVRSSLLARQDYINEDNFSDELATAVQSAFAKRSHIQVRDAITAAFPDAVYDASRGVVNEKFIPLYETARKIVFEHGLAGDITEPTDPPTDPPTQRPTDPPTQPPTDPPTQPASEPSQPATEPASEPTQKPTSSQGTGGPGGPGGQINDEDDATEAPTEKTTAQENATTPTQVTQTTQPNENQTDVKFSDMASAAWAEESVYALVKMGIISGMGDGTFAPNRSITRAEFSKIIVMTAGKYDAKATCSFTDVKSGDWFYSYVASAKNLGLISGRSDTIFDPNAPITRAEICIIVYRYIKSVNPEFGQNTANAPTFKDAAQIPSYAVEAVKALSAAGIISGMEGGDFAPNTPATRAQSARIVYGAIQQTKPNA